MLADRPAKQPAKQPVVHRTTDDPRFQPGAYITNGRALYEVLQTEGYRLVIQDCISENKSVKAGWTIEEVYRLVKPAPSSPDTADLAVTA